MGAGEIVSRSGDKGGESGDEVSRREQRMSGAIVEGAFEAQADSAVGVQRQAYESNSRASTIICR